MRNVSSHAQREQGYEPRKFDLVETLSQESDFHHKLCNQF